MNIYRKKDWNQVLSLEKEKNHLMLDNLRKEKVIFENRNKEEEWLIRNQGYFLFFSKT